MDQKKLLLVAAVCGGVIFIGVLMPWVSVNMGPMGSTSASGTSAGFDGGVFILILGLVGGAAAAMVALGKTDIIKMAPKQQILIGGACFALALLLTFINFFKDFGPSVGGMGASRGIGLYLTLLAAIAGTACVGMVLKQMGVIGGGGAGKSSDSGAGDA